MQHAIACESTHVHRVRSPGALTCVASICRLSGSQLPQTLQLMPPETSLTLAPTSQLSPPVAAFPASCLPVPCSRVQHLASLLKLVVPRRYEPVKIHDLKRLEKVKAGMKLEDVKVRFEPCMPVLGV